MEPLYDVSSSSSSPQPTGSCHLSCGCLCHPLTLIFKAICGSKEHVVVDDRTRFENLCNCRITKLQMGEYICYSAPLGSGSYGLVFKGRKAEPLLGPDVALKFSECSEEELEISRNEAKYLKIFRDLDPEGRSEIIRLESDFYYAGRHVLALEHIKFSLRKLLDNYNEHNLQMDLEEVSRIVHHVLHALNFALNAPGSIIHRDLKPENVLANEVFMGGRLHHNIVKLADWGMACESNGNKKQQTNLVQTRMYRAPEVFLGMPYDSAIDVWSTGCLLVELLQCTPLFPSKNAYHHFDMVKDLLGNPPSHMSPVETSDKPTTPLVSNMKGPLSFEGRKKNIMAKIHRSRPRQVNHKKLDDLGDLATKMLEWDPQTRITAADALQHPCFK